MNAETLGAVTGCVSVVAGAVASVCGFGIGSLLTPVLCCYINTKLAVAAVSVPHFFGTALRCYMLRKDINKPVLLSFGITSAMGGLAGALAHNYLQSSSLTLVFGIILIFAGLMGASGASERLFLRGAKAWIAGGVSGVLGGLVGNQGGIRSAALLAFDLNKSAFVATATAIGLCVDGARMPVYFISQAKELAGIWPLTTIASAGVVVGTFAGMTGLAHIKEREFKCIVSAVILALGVWMLYQSLTGP